MSTYAVYRLWAGVATNDLEEEHPFIIKVLESMDPVQANGLDFTSIAMHGEKVGVGVEVNKLDWETEIGAPNLYDHNLSSKAVEILQGVNETFKKLGIAVEAKLYHHIDLGG